MAGTGTGVHGWRVQEPEFTDGGYRRYNPHRRHSGLDYLEEAPSPFGLEPRPPPRMLFRPEEVHPTSSIGPVVAPLAARQVRVPTEARRVPGFDDPVTHLGAKGVSAIEAWRLDQDRLSREEPADRWRLKRSLGEPLLQMPPRDPPSWLCSHRVVPHRGVRPHPPPQRSRRRRDPRPLSAARSRTTP